MDVLLVDHPIIQLVLPNVSPVRMPLHQKWYMLDMCDWLHIAWRLRTLYLSAKRNMLLGGMTITHSKLLSRAEDLHLNLSDLDASNKQAYVGMLKIFDFSYIPSKKLAKETNHIRDALLGHTSHRSNYLFIEFCHTFTRMFVIKGLSPREIILDASFCIMFLGFWRRDVESRFGKKEGRSSHLLSRETHQDVLTTCMMLILSIKLFREVCPHVLFEPSRMSSRFCEYVFQHARAVTKTSSKFDALQFVHIMRGMVVALEVVATNDGMPTMQAKRGMQHNTGRTTGWNKAPEGYYPADDEMLDIITQVINNV